MTETRLKYMESLFFFERMKEIHEDRYAFGCYLSAFVQASMAIIELMDREFQNKNGFTNWKKNKLEKLKENTFYNHIYKSRRLTFHQKNIKFKNDISLSIIDQLSMGSSMTTIVNYDFGETFTTLSKPPENFKNDKQKWYFSDNENDDIVTICSLYTKEMKLIVDECEKFFLNPDA